MMRACLTSLVAIVIAATILCDARADDRFPQEADPDFGEKLVAAIAAIKPLPETPIPDDPPPHEGALIDIPYVVEPPDLVRVEVLEALPGRPISGERLVRSDGTIDIGFYGAIHVRGLTCEQIKVKVVEHLRFYLPDTTLGLFEEVGPPPEEILTPIDPRGLPPLPPAPFERDEPKEPPTRPKTPSTGEPAGRHSGLRKMGPRGFVALAKHDPGEKPQAPAGAPAGVIDKNRIPSPPGPDLEKPSSHVAVPRIVNPVAPEKTNRIFVDVSAYNSKFYSVVGDVASPGRLPITGGDTILEALQRAGGLIATADPSEIRLVRPARGGKPTKVYMIDFEAITERGEKRRNYQLFPDDRIIVGRNKLVQTTIFLDRLAATFQNLEIQLTQASSMTRSLVQATPDLTPAQREAIVKEWFEIVWKQSNQSGGPTPDEKTFRELLIRLLKTVPPPEKK